MTAFTGGFTSPPERTKPWGTAHAVLCAKDAVNEPFAVINADDFYGRDAFAKAKEFLAAECREDLYAIIGYDLANTLSAHGSVSRGVCKVDKNSFLIGINERTNIYRENGKIVYEENGEKTELNENSPVSMNFFCFDTSVFSISERMFQQFLRENGDNPKAEFFIPIVADKFIQQDLGRIKVIPTPSKWFGVTYKEDAADVRKKLMELVNKGEYPKKITTPG
jgi:choline kinase